MKSAAKTICEFDDIVVYNNAKDAIERMNLKHFSPIKEWEMGDVVHDAYLKLKKASSQFDADKGTLSAWVNSSAARTFFDASDSKQRHRTVFESYDGFDGEWSSVMAEGSEYEEYVTDCGGYEFTDGCNALSMMIEKERMEWLDMEIGKLSERQQNVIKLVLAGHKTAQIAAILGCTPNAVSIALNKAKVSLATRWAEFEASENVAHKSPRASASSLAA